MVQGQRPYVSLPKTHKLKAQSPQIRGPIYKDLVSLTGTSLSVAQQSLGVASYISHPPAFPNDGLVGFAGEDGSALPASPWYVPHKHP